MGVWGLGFGVRVFSDFLCAVRDLGVQGCQRESLGSRGT